MAQCKVCKESIRQGVQICSHCGQYQSRWRNELKYGASIAGFVGLAISGLSFTVAQIQSLVADWFSRPSVEVLSYSTPNDAYISNSGRGIVYVADITLKNRFESTVKSVGKVISPGDVISISLDHRKAPWSILPDFPIDDFAQIREDRPGCIEIWVYDENNSALSMYSDYYKNKLKTIPIKGLVRFYSIEDRRMLASQVNLVGVVAGRPIPECQKDGA